MTISLHNILILLAIVFAVLAALNVPGRIGSAERPSNWVFNWFGWSWLCYLFVVFIVTVK